MDELTKCWSGDRQESSCAEYPQWATTVCVCESERECVCPRRALSLGSLRSSQAAPPLSDSAPHGDSRSCTRLLPHTHTLWFKWLLNSTDPKQHTHTYPQFHTELCCSFELTGSADGGFTSRTQTAPLVRTQLLIPPLNNIWPFLSWLITWQNDQP